MADLKQLRAGYDLAEEHVEALCALYYTVRRLNVTAIAADMKDHVVTQTQKDLAKRLRRLATLGLIRTGWSERYTGTIRRALQRCKSYELTEEGLRVARIFSPYSVSRIF
jgi:hypothetical protein